MKNVFIVKYTNLKEKNPTFAIDSVFTNEEEAEKYVKIQNEYYESVRNEEHHWLFIVGTSVTLRTKALISEEPIEEAE